ncbi:hypothetical protein C1I98_01560 [Spongiactinospora gelatinilytica]|uniref:Uncharacterized protein n=1 Tax=Spongiactinospora gelatinilytica TaxID=2666298 RepID=A0A2W2J3Z8_9ACTN|nr:hypothetical protein [Spongiactinospora gelatinilytica]PZG56344.1 hypothetical protein C1I98_01560 [Spongiactinospora gelatinilytica]
MVSIAIRLSCSLGRARSRLQETRAENRRLVAEVEEFARVVNVLTVENHQLRQARAGQAARVRPLPARS